MQTFNIPETNLEELNFVYYRLKAMDDLLNDHQRNKYGIAPKWNDYLTEIHKDLKRDYEAVTEKLAYQFAPFDNFSYCIDITKGCINYCES